MTEIVGWQPIALRLFLTVVAGFLIGFNRGEHGEPAGLRTTLLVCLAASISMIQANLLLGTTGKASDSYVVLDLMRFPLGVLTGVGFIGAGAIFREHDRVRGVTTAATLWFVTMIGLCFGGGQIGLGIGSTAIGLAVLWGLKLLEKNMAAERRALLVLTIKPEGPTAHDVRMRLQQGGFKITRFAETYFNAEDPRLTLQCSLRWRSQPHDTEIPRTVHELAQAQGVLELQWKP